MLPNIQTSKRLTTIIDSVPYSVDLDHLKYQELVDATNNGDKDEFLKAYNYKTVITEKTNGKIKVIDEEVYYDGTQLHGTIVDRILKMIDFDENMDSMIKFLENLFDNPSMNSVNQLYNFLDKENLPITDDGCFLGYKSVVTYKGSVKTDENGKNINNGDLVDKYSKTIRNNIDDIVSKPRNKIDDNPNSHCSHGLHVGGLNYSGPNGWYNGDTDTILIVKVNPKDCVSVPNDHNFEKLRVCEYKVVSIYKGALNKPVYNEEDDLDYNKNYEVEEKSDNVVEAKLENLGFDDKINFVYHNKARYLSIDSSTSMVRNDHYKIISGYLLSGDDDFINDSEPQYRNFFKDEMQDIRYFNE